MQHKQRSGYATFASSQQSQQTLSSSKSNLHSTTCPCHCCGGSRCAPTHLTLIFCRKSFDVGLGELLRDAERDDAMSCQFEVHVPCAEAMVYVPFADGMWCLAVQHSNKPALFKAGCSCRNIVSLAAPLGGISVGQHIFRLR